MHLQANGRSTKRCATTERIDGRFKGSSVRQWFLIGGRLDQRWKFLDPDRLTFLFCEESSVALRDMRCHNDEDWDSV